LCAKSCDRARWLRSAHPTYSIGFLDNRSLLARFSPNVGNPEGFMAKNTTIKVKLVSSADTGFYYVTRKNSRTMTDKLVKKKYDPVAKKHVEFRESKIK
jgi:large subunit ribosomal protein L33